MFLKNVEVSPFLALTKSIDFDLVGTGFTLDVSRLDVDSFGDSRAANVQFADINRSGETFALGFFLDKIDGRMNIIKAQIDFNKNGNRN